MEKMSDIVTVSQLKLIVTKFVLYDTLVVTEYYILNLICDIGIEGVISAVAHGYVHPTVGIAAPAVATPFS